MSKKQCKIPAPALYRMALYLQLIRELREKKQQWVSSHDLAETLGLGSSSVRQDLSCLDITGTANRGYETDAMERALISVLGREQPYRMVIVGAGNLGRALALHEEFPRQGFRVCGIFDADRRMVGRKVGKLVVQSMDKLHRTVREKAVQIGVIAVPAKDSQEVADQLVSTRVAGLLNMAYSHVLAPEDIPVVSPRLFASLSLLTYAIKEQRIKNSEDSIT